MASKLVELVAASRNKNIDTSCLISYRAFKETQYEKLADILEASLDMPAIYEMLGIDRGDLSS